MLVVNHLLRIILLTICFIQVDGQSYYFRHYQVENGLSNNAVICSVQDHKGFLWFGTKDGLNRFDGYSFKVFRNIPNDTSSIGSNFIRSLFEDIDVATALLVRHVIILILRYSDFRYDNSNRNFF